VGGRREMADPQVEEVKDDSGVQAVGEGAVEVAALRPDGAVVAAGEAGEAATPQLTPEQEAQRREHEKIQKRFQELGIKKEHFQTVYPQYVDKMLTCKQGRRVSKDICSPQPHVFEVMQACKELGLYCYVENKGYPRELQPSPGPDQFGRKLHRGRVRVLLKLQPKEGEDSRALEKDEIPTKDVLLKKICEIIPKLPSRQAPPPGAQAPAPVSTGRQAKKEKKKKK